MWDGRKLLAGLPTKIAESKGICVLYRFNILRWLVHRGVVSVICAIALLLALTAYGKRAYLQIVGPPAIRVTAFNPNSFVYDPAKFEPKIIAPDTNAIAAAPPAPAPGTNNVVTNPPPARVVVASA